MEMLSNASVAQAPKDFIVKEIAQVCCLGSRQ